MEDLAPYVLTIIEGGWSFVAISLLIYYLGGVSKRVAKKKGWHHADSWYDVTVRAHPLLAGLLFGVVPLPIPAWFDGLRWWELLLVRCFWFMLAGALCGQVYALVKYGVAWARRRAGLESSTPSEPPAESGDGA